MSKLGSLLVRERLLSESDRKFIQRERGNYRGSFARSVLAMGLLDEDELAALFAAKTAFKIAAKKLTNQIQGDAVGCVPGPLLQWFDVIPMKKQSGALHVAMIDPTDREIISQLEFFSGMPIRPVIAPLSEIREAIAKHVVGKLDFHRSEFEDFLSNHSDHASRFARRQKGAFGVIDITDEPISWGTESDSSDSYDSSGSGNEMFELLTDDSEPEVLVSSAPEQFAETRHVAASELVPSAVDDFSDAGLGAETQADDELVDDATAQQSMVADVFTDEGDDSEFSNEKEFEKSGALSGDLNDLSFEDEDLDLSADLDIGFEGDEIETSKKTEITPSRNKDAPLAPTLTAATELNVDSAMSNTEETQELSSLVAEDSGLDMGLDAPLESEKRVELAAASLEDSPVAVEVEPSPETILTSLDSHEDSVGFDAPESSIIGDEPSFDLSDEAVLGEELAQANSLPDEDKNASQAPELEAQAAFDLDGVLSETAKNETSLEQESALDLTTERQVLGAELTYGEPPGTSDKISASSSEVSLDLNDDLSSLGEDGQGLSLENDISPSSSDLNLSTSAFDISLEQEPSVDVEALSETFEPEEPSLDRLSGKALYSQASSESAPSVSTTAHEGVATLNRALVNLALLTDGKKALSRLADAADKVGIVSGAVLKVAGTSLKPGILWNREEAQLGSIYDVPAGLSGETIAKALTDMGDDKLECWLDISAALGKSTERFKSAWPAPDNVPTHFYARKQGDSCTVAIVRFTGLADHGGIRDAFGELVRAVATKI